MIALSLQAAIYKRLESSLALKKLIKAVYDEVPEEFYKSPTAQNNFYPFVIVGDDSHEPNDTRDTYGFISTFTIHIYSNYRGNSEVAKIQNCIFNILHEKPLPVENFTTTNPTQTKSDINREPDGRTRHGTQTYTLFCTSVFKKHPSLKNPDIQPAQHNRRNLVISRNLILRG